MREQVIQHILPFWSVAAALWGLVNIHLFIPLLLLLNYRLHAPLLAGPGRCSTEYGHNGANFLPLPACKP
jgi:hypothetical protein